MELLDIVDEAGRPTGETVERTLAHREGIRHRTAHVWIARRRGGVVEVLLQKRSAQKDSFPGLYDTSSAGHIPAGAQPRDSAIRELREELGIAARPQQLLYLGHIDNRYEMPFRGVPFRDNEFCNVFLYRGAVAAESLRLQKEEVDRVDWFPLALVRDEIAVSRARFCVPSQSIALLCRHFALKQGAEGGEISPKSAAPAGIKPLQ